MNKTYVMDFNDFPVKQDCDGEDINRQNDQTSEIEKHTSRHSDNDSCAEALQTKSMNTSRRKNRPPGLHDGPHQRVYHQNELLRIGAAFGAAGLRRTHTGREDPSGFSSSGELYQFSFDAAKYVNANMSCN